MQFELAGKTFRIELQSPEEAAGDSCSGCFFDLRQVCTMPAARNIPSLRFEDQREAVEWACTNNVSAVWKEISQ